MVSIMGKRTAILFGATGLVGSQLLEILNREEEYAKIVLFNRKTVHYDESLSPKIVEIITDFSDLKQLEGYCKGSDLFCCLGTTIKKAKTQENFRQVDFDLPVVIASMASQKPFNRFVVISSIGANAESRNFYLRTKGEMEQAVRGILGEKVFIVRPSMLLGKRNETRFGEILGKWFTVLLSPVMIGKLLRYKGIQASDVAKAMVYIAIHGSDSQIIESEKLQKLSKIYHV
jgi:uncharacterized protein YbjT (DUF2867 family)